MWGAAFGKADRGLAKGRRLCVSVQRFVLQENIRNFQSRLREAADAPTRAHVGAMLAAAQRELALLDAVHDGVRHPWETDTPEQLAVARAEKLAWFRDEFAAAPSMAALIDPGPGLLLVDINRAYEGGIGVTREQVVGKPVFAAFPDNPEDPQANGVASMYASLRQVSDTGREHALPDQRYDIMGADGRFAERYWRPVNTPVHDDEGRLIYLLQTVREVTAEVLARRRP